MDIATIRDWITSHLDDVHVIEANGDLFFMDSPESKMPFATIVTSNAHDTASDLDRPGAYRLNIGVARETYEARFGPLPSGPIGIDPVDTGHDSTRRDTLMPHPIYSPLAWFCVVDPSDATFASLTPLLEEAHAIASGRTDRREARD